MHACIILLFQHSASGLPLLKSGSCVCSSLNSDPVVSQSAELMYQGGKDATEFPAQVR